MTKKDFIRVIGGKVGSMSYPNGNSFTGEVIVKSKEFVLDGLHVPFTSLEKITLVPSYIEFETINGKGWIRI